MYSGHDVCLIVCAAGLTSTTSQSSPIATPRPMLLLRLLLLLHGTSIDVGFLTGLACLHLLKKCLHPHANESGYVSIFLGKVQLLIFVLLVSHVCADRTLCASASTCMKGFNVAVIPQPYRVIATVVGLFCRRFATRSVFPNSPGASALVNGFVAEFRNPFTAYAPPTPPLSHRTELIPPTSISITITITTKTNSTHRVSDHSERLTCAPVASSSMSMGIRALCRTK